LLPPAPFLLSPRSSLAGQRRGDSGKGKAGIQEKAGWRKPGGSGPKVVVGKKFFNNSIVQAVVVVVVVVAVLVVVVVVIV
jgi:hypothetical protein